MNTFSDMTLLNRLDKRIAIPKVTSPSLPFCRIWIRTTCFILNLWVFKWVLQDMRVILLGSITV